MSVDSRVPTCFYGASGVHAPWVLRNKAPLIALPLPKASPKGFSRSGENEWAHTQVYGARAELHLPGSNPALLVRFLVYQLLLLAGPRVPHTREGWRAGVIALLLSRQLPPFFPFVFSIPALDQTAFPLPLSSVKDYLGKRSHGRGLQDTIVNCTL